MALAAKKLRFISWAEAFTLPPNTITVVGKEAAISPVRHEVRAILSDRPSRDARSWVPPVARRMKRD
jgi:hypothetical protein